MFQNDEHRNPILLFIILYVLSLSIFVIFYPFHLFIVFFGLFFLILIPSITKLTKNMSVIQIQTSNEIYELSLALILAVASIIYFRIILNISDIWFSILWKNVFMVIFPLLILYRTYSLPDFGFSTNDLKKNLFVGGILSLIVGVILAIAYFASHMFADPYIYITNVLIGLFIYFLAAALPEEFLFRGVIQTRISNLFKSAKAGIFYSAIIFGLMHIPILYLGTHSILYAFAHSIVFQAVIGIMFGYLWERTKNLIAPIMLHATIDAFIVLLLI